VDNQTRKRQRRAYNTEKNMRTWKEKQNMRKIHAKIKQGKENEQHGNAENTTRHIT